MYFWPACLASFAQSRAAFGFGLKFLGELLVFGHRNAFVFHGPFVAPERAVQAPVDEHAEARFVPPLHAAFAIGVARGWGSAGRFLRSFLEQLVAAASAAPAPRI